nr:zinc-regulated protein 8-like [Ipomoea batatas]
MAAQKQYLHELLREDQQPFHLKSYISDRKSQLKLMMRDDSHSLVHVGTRKSFVETLTLKQRSLCKRSCLFSFRGSPEVGFPSPASAKTQNGRVLLHVPAGTAALLLEAATRIQGPRIKNCGLGLFGSVLKRLKERNSKKKIREVKNIEEQHELGFPCAYNHRRRRRLSSAGWSDESNDDKKMPVSRSPHAGILISGGFSRSSQNTEAQKSYTLLIRATAELPLNSELMSMREEERRDVKEGDVSMERYHTEVQSQIRRNTS